MRKRQWVFTAIAAISMSASASAFASELVYHPVNPTFGGNPLNGTFLLSTAQAQGEGTKSGQQSPDLSGLDNALSNLGNGSSAIVIGGQGNNGSGGGNGGSTGSTGSGGGTNATNSAFRAARIAQPTNNTQAGSAGFVP
jgi:curli production assembly/transport component CsgF